MRGIREQLEAQQQIQDMIAQDAPLEDTLCAICAMVEQLRSGAMCSIMLFNPDEQTISLRAGNRLPKEYREAMQNVPIGAEAGSCGSAAYFHKSVITEDIQEDPRWEEHQELACQYGLRACWSYPVLTRSDRLLGTFATYYRMPRQPDVDEQEQIARAAGLAALAVERQQDRQALLEGEQRYRSLFTHHPDAVFCLDAKGIFRSVNPALSRITGFDEKGLVGLHYSRFIAAEELARTNEAFEQALRGEPQHYESLAINAKGERYYLDITNLPMVVGGQVVGVYGIAKDITQRKKSETHLRLLQRSVEASVNGIVVADALQPGTPLVYANAPFLKMTGYELDEVLGSNCRFLQGPETDPDAIALIRDRIAARRDVHVTIRNYRKDGATFWNDLYISPVPDEMGNVTHFVGILNDISEHKAYEARLSHQATHDALTGLANRALLEERLVHDYQLAQRQGGLLEVLFVDLDDFKPINDSLGHAAGDMVLIEATRRLSCLVRQGDTLARLGGDEFVMLLPNLSRYRRGGEVAEKALELLAQPYQISDRDVHITASIGVATSRGALQQPLELIQHADMAMYQAKTLGRNTYHWFTPEITDSINDRVTLRRDLHEAIKAGDFELHYQPLIRAADGSACGVEALIRWQHPTRGYISPAAFIPLAEQTGQIVPLGRWVMERASRDLVTLNELLDEQYPVAINVSPLQFHRSDFLDTLRSVLAETGLPAGLMEIELTEGVLMENTEAAIDTLQNLRDMGICVSIDDFGTGFSSLSYLKNLPISRVKIDRSFVNDITGDTRSAAIAQGIITMAHHLGLQVVAEGIETEEQYQNLARRECDLFQGFLFARPMPLEQLQRYLAQRGKNTQRDRPI